MARPHNCAAERPESEEREAYTIRSETEVKIKLGLSSREFAQVKNELEDAVTEIDSNMERYPSHRSNCLIDKHMLQYLD